MSTQRMEVGGFVYEPDPPRASKSTGWTVFAVITSQVKQWMAEFVRERAFRRAEWELHSLDDRMLRDMGLSRGEIASAVRNPEQERINGAQLPLTAQF